MYLSFNQSLNKFYLSTCAVFFTSLKVYLLVSPGGNAAAAFGNVQGDNTDIARLGGHCWGPKDAKRNALNNSADGSIIPPQMPVVCHCE